jgi:hypothetical protein
MLTVSGMLLPTMIQRPLGVPAGRGLQSGKPVAKQQTSQVTATLEHLNL